jgi:hypothetical protein
MAFVITSVLGMAGSSLLLPANRHLAATLVSAAATNGTHAHGTDHNPRVKKLVNPSRYAWVYFPLVLLVAVLVTAVILHVTTLLVGMESLFSRNWSIAMNVALISWGIRQLVWGGLVAIRSRRRAKP